MERIVLEINDELARAWRNAPAKVRKKLEKDFENQISEKMRQAEREDLFRLIGEVQEDARKRGLTHDKLEDLLNGD